MVALTKTLDNDNDTMGGGFVLGVADHPFIIVGEEVKTAQSGSNYLQFQCVTDGGPQPGTEFTINLNLWHPNATAVEIAERELNTIRIACGLGPINDSNQLINQRAIAVVKAKTRGKNAGEIFIANYESAGATQAGANPQPAQHQHPATAQHQSPAQSRPQPPAKSNPQPPQTAGPPQSAGGAPWRQ